MSNEHAFGWDDTIENDSSYVLLPEGEYDFVVEKFERGHHAGSAKMPACPKAILTLRVTGSEGSTTITENLLLHSKMEWKLCQFFTSIGQRKHGEKMKMDWNRVFGTRGRCKVYIDTYTKNDGTEGKSNKIAEFLEPQAAAAPSFTPGTF